jgi:uncharacterized protein with ParB-like and HNH nuclease domain
MLKKLSNNKKRELLLVSKVEKLLYMISKLFSLPNLKTDGKTSLQKKKFFLSPCTNNHAADMPATLSA